MEPIESEIAEWRAFVGQDPAVELRDVEELEAHLRDQIADLTAAGLAPDEAFLVAVKRMGSLDELSREFAREHSGRLWRQLVLSGGGEQQRPDSRWPEALVFAVAAAVTVQIARLAAGFPNEESLWLLRNASLFVLPFLAGYFARRRRLSFRRWILTATPFAIAAVIINLYPYTQGSSTELLVAAHLPVVLWFVVAYPYTGGVVRSQERRMDFVRFTGEWFIYYVLIALGGGVLLALTVLILEPTGVANAERLVEWVLPSGATGAVVVAAWLVESKQRVVENMAPVLTMLFTPLFALMLAGVAVVYAMTGLGGAFDRETPRRLRRPAGGGPGTRPVRRLCPGHVHVAGLDGPHPTGRRGQRPPPRRDGARRDDRPDRRTRVHPKPNSGPRPQPPAPREPGRNRLAIHPVPHQTRHLPWARTLADHLPPRLRPVGRRGGGHPPTTVRLHLNA